MTDFLVFLAQSLSIFSRWLGARTPVPWPLMLATLFPFFAATLSIWVWWLRGTAWPLRCDYPVTVRKHPCRNVVTGEWFRCRVHNKRWTRRTDRHVVEAKLRRWETVDRAGAVADRPDVVGRGFVRLSSQQSTLLYRRGFARPPGDVIRFIPNWYRIVRSRWRRLRVVASELRGERWSWRRLLDPGKSSDTHPVVSDVVPRVIHATRAALLSVAAGLILVAAAELAKGDIRSFLQYMAALCFVCTWAVMKDGIWAAEPNWPALAWRSTCRWAIPFFIFSVTGGIFVAMAPST